MATKTFYLQILAASALTFLDAGCGSVGYQGAPQAAAQPEIIRGPNKLYIRSAEVSRPVSIGIYQAEVATVLSAVTAKRLSAALASKYPNSFAAEDGIPLDLSMTLAYENHFGSRMGTAMLCGFSFGVIPFWMDSEYRFTVSTNRAKGPLNKALAKKSGETLVQRKGWASIIPTGYIPCPQHSDLPREYITGPVAVEAEVSDAARDLITQQVATEVARLFTGTQTDDLKRALLLQSFEE